MIENGSFSWGEEELVLKNINMRVNRANLVAVVGTVGSGKTSSAFIFSSYSLTFNIFSSIKAKAL